MKRFFLFSISLLLCFSIYAQQEIGRDRAGAVQVESPVISPNNSVTFNLLAPNAQSVSLSGDVMRGLGISERSVSMVKGENGVWSYTSSGPVPSDLYTYSFTVDGLRMLDPNNEIGRAHV